MSFLQFLSDEKLVSHQQQFPIFPVRNRINISKIKGSKHGPEYKTSLTDGSFRARAEPSSTILTLVVSLFSFNECSVR